MALLAALAPFVPLGQTLLWTLLVLFLVIWFRRSVQALLSAIQKRIEEGSSVEAGPFKLSQLVKPQTPDQQKQRATQEISEAMQQVVNPSGTTVPAASTETIYFQAEDLALRALQAEYGVPIQRSVAIGTNHEVDGLFVRDRRLYVVEVKLNLGSISKEKLRHSLRRASEAAFQVGGPAAAVALVLVFKRDEDIAANEPRVRELLDEQRIKVDLWLYSLPKLREKFGAAAGDA